MEWKNPRRLHGRGRASVRYKEKVRNLTTWGSVVEAGRNPQGLTPARSPPRLASVMHMAWSSLPTLMDISRQNSNPIS